MNAVFYTNQGNTCRNLSNKYKFSCKNCTKPIKGAVNGECSSGCGLISSFFTMTTLKLSYVSGLLNGILGSWSLRDISSSSGMYKENVLLQISKSTIINLYKIALHSCNFCYFFKLQFEYLMVYLWIFLTILLNTLFSNSFFEITERSC